MQTKTVRVIKRKNAYLAKVEAIEPLGLNKPPQGALKHQVYAREIARRASYQLLSIDERESWSAKGSLISARPIIFDGMSRQDYIRATPSEIIARMLADIEKKLDGEEFSRVRDAVEQAWKDLDL